MSPSTPETPREPPCHPLDNPVWSALTTRHRGIAIKSGNARRYPAEIAPFAAIRDTSGQSIADLAGIVVTGETVVLVSPTPVPLDDDRFTVTRRTEIHQMIATILPAPGNARKQTVLNASDLPDVLDLVAQTRPGPFGPRTMELGEYRGVRANGVLAAMTGERFRLDGFTEVSAVCTHPDFRGQGLSFDLVVQVSRSIQARGAMPFLHVFTDNAPAISLYRKAGFRLRKTLALTVLERCGA